MNETMIKNLCEGHLMAIAATKEGCPSGHLYALFCMPLGGTLEDHTRAVSALKRTGLVGEAYHVLKWAGPEEQRKALAAALEKDKTQP